MKISKKKFQANPITYKSRKFCPSLQSFSNQDKESKEEKEKDDV